MAHFTQTTFTTNITKQDLVEIAAAQAAKSQCQLCCELAERSSCKGCPIHEAAERARAEEDARRPVW